MGTIGGGAQCGEGRDGGGGGKWNAEGYIIT